MIQILTNTGDIRQPWARRHLQGILKPGMKACILAMSDFADVQDQKDWLRDYGPGGMWHQAYEAPLHTYGIRDITWLSPFRDDRQTMLEAIRGADLVILPGGAPERLIKQIRRFGLKKAIRQAPVLFGISAGAMVQLADYHITPDADYDTFAWYTGMGLLPFDLECHYTASRHQKQHLQRAQAEKGLLTYALYEDGGLLVKDAQVTAMGHVERFEAPAGNPAGASFVQTEPGRLQ